MKLQWNTASRYFFLILNYLDNYLSIASVLFVNLPENSGIFVIIMKSSRLIIRSAVRALTDKFRRPINRFFQVALYFLLLILTVDLYFVLFMRLCLNAQECAHLIGKILLGVSSSKVVVKLECLLMSFQ